MDIVLSEHWTTIVAAVGFTSMAMSIDTEALQRLNDRLHKHTDFLRFSLQFYGDSQNE
jgi:hypothetical protein